MYEDETRNIQNWSNNCVGGGGLIWTESFVILIILNDRLFLLSETYTISTNIYNARTIAFTSKKIWDIPITY